MTVDNVYSCREGDVELMDIALVDGWWRAKFRAPNDLYLLGIYRPWKSSGSPAVCVVVNMEDISTPINSAAYQPAITEMVDDEMERR